MLLKQTRIHNQRFSKNDNYQQWIPAACRYNKQLLALTRRSQSWSALSTCHGREIAWTIAQEQRSCFLLSHIAKFLSTMNGTELHNGRISDPGSLSQLP